MATNECYSAESLSVMKHNFNEKIKEIRRIAKKNCVSLSREKYNSIIKDVLSSKSSASKKPRDYWLLQHYDVLFVGNNEKLIVPLKDLRECVNDFPDIWIQSLVNMVKHLFCFHIFI